jgi:diguanylate cyclase (GGDEF)-like protein
MFQPLAKIVYQHHERYDGTGYPNKLHADEITPLARIMIVADAFDAMTTNRIYKTHKQTSEAIEELKRLSKKQFHPEVVKHAIIALKDVVIDTEINQLPKTKLEEERFAYFYKDTLTQVYNQNYLDVVLMRNRYKPLFTKMLIFSIHNFSQYNKEKGWEAGDQLLKEFAEILSIHLEEELIFRVFGDDFVAITKRELYLDGLQSVLDDLMKNIIINYEIMKIDLQARKIETLSDIEMIYTLQKAAKETTTAL